MLGFAILLGSGNLTLLSSHTDQMQWNCLANDSPKQLRQHVFGIHLTGVLSNLGLRKCQLLIYCAGKFYFCTPWFKPLYHLLADINWQCKGWHWILLELVLLEHIYPNMVCYKHVLHSFPSTVEISRFLVAATKKKEERKSI